METHNSTSVFYITPACVFDQTDFSIDDEIHITQYTQNTMYQSYNSSSGIKLMWCPFITQSRSPLNQYSVGSHLLYFPAEYPDLFFPSVLVCRKQAEIMIW